MTIADIKRLNPSRQENIIMNTDKTYSLQAARQSTGWAFVSVGEKSGAITRLIDLANYSGTNHRIIDERGVVVWQRINHQEVR